MDPEIVFDELEELIELREKYLKYGQHLARRLDQVRRAKNQLWDMRKGRSYGELVVDRMEALGHVEFALLQQLRWALAALKALEIR